jgi:hypothetical protein
MAASTCVESVRWRPRTHLSEEGVEQQQFGLPGDKPGPELAQHGIVEVRVGQLEA